MAKSTAKNNQLTPTQEGIIAGIVLLFFGLLYWYLNPWKSDNAAQQLVTSQQNSTAGSSTLPRASTTATSATVDTDSSTNAQAASATNTATPNNLAPTSTAAPQTIASTTAATIAAPPYPTETAPAVLESAKPPVLSESAKSEARAQQEVTTTETMSTAANEATKPTEVAMTQPSSENTSLTAAPEPAKSTEATANNIAPSNPSEINQPTNLGQTTATSSTPEIATSAETTANIEAAKPATTEQTTVVTTNTEPTQALQATAATSNESSSSTTQAASTISPEQRLVASATPSKLILAPGSPEAKLQSYLENNTLEKPVAMANIQFEAKKTQLTKSSEAQTLMLAALLGQYPEANFLITAYTTEVNTDQTSDQLSLMRANALGLELVKAGVDGKRITIMGMGNKPPVDKSSAAQKKNQRIEISVIK